MARVSAEDCLRNIPNPFALCIVAATRARQLMAGARPTLVCDNKAAVTSLREIAAGHVFAGEVIGKMLEVHISESKALERDRSVVRSRKRQG